jgi:amino acid permease
MEEWARKYEKGPNAFMVIHPEGRPVISVWNFIWELLSSILGVLLAAFLVYKSGAQAFWCKVGVVTFMGIFAWITISIPYWNWYRFLLDFTLAQGIDEIISWFLGGMVIAWIVKDKESDRN